MSYSEIKYAVNSTIGKQEFAPLDQVLINSFGGHQLFDKSGTFTVPSGIKEIYISGCGAGGTGGKGSSQNNVGGGIGGKAGQFVIRERVITSPGSIFNITVGNGNTVITSNDGYSKTLTANSIRGATVTDILGFKTGYPALPWEFIDSAGVSFASTYMGHPGESGAFGFGGAGGQGKITKSDYSRISASKGGSQYITFNNRWNYISPRQASLINGEDAVLETTSSSYLPPKDGNKAGGYGAGGGGGGQFFSNEPATNGGSGSPGMVYIEWGGLR